MENQISRIASHVYVNNGKEAVKAYMDAFRLEEKGEPLLDDYGILIYQGLQLGASHFISVSDDQCFGDEVKRERPSGACFSVVNHCVYFAKEEDLRRAFDILYTEGNRCSGFREDKEGKSIFSCDIDFIDKFGVSWYFCVRRDWDAPDPNSPFGI